MDDRYEVLGIRVIENEKLRSKCLCARDVDTESCIPLISPMIGICEQCKEYCANSRAHRLHLRSSIVRVIREKVNTRGMGNGCHQDVVTMNFPDEDPERIMKIMDELHNFGLIYRTIDDHHFKALSLSFRFL